MTEVAQRSDESRFSKSSERLLPQEPRNGVSGVRVYPRLDDGSAWRRGRVVTRCVRARCETSGDDRVVVPTVRQPAPAAGAQRWTSTAMVQ